MVATHGKMITKGKQMKTRKYEITLTTGEKFSWVTNQDISDEEAIKEFMDDLGFGVDVVVKATVEEEVDVS